jgi:hypothetical protein
MESTAELPRYILCMPLRLSGKLAARRDAICMPSQGVLLTANSLFHTVHAGAPIYDNLLSSPPPQVGPHHPQRPCQSVAARYYYHC